MNDRAVPEVFAGVVFAPDTPAVVFTIVKTSVSLVLRNASIVVDRGNSVVKTGIQGFEGQHVNAERPGQFLDCGNFVFVMPHNDESKIDERCPGSQYALLLHNVPDTFQDGFQRAAASVSFVALLRDPVHHENKGIEP
jgi:hypothetical protein